MAAVPLRAVPQSPEGFYSIDYQFLTSGPKRSEGFKKPENEGMFVRIDLPGVPEEGVRVSLDTSKKALCVYAEAPMVHKHDSSRRETLIIIDRICRCCEIGGFTSEISNGVLRLLLTNITPSCTLNLLFFIIRSIKIYKLMINFLHNLPFSTAFRRFRKDLCVQEISMDPYDYAYESKQLENGSLYVRLDMPGVPKENFTVSVANGRVKVTGQAPAVGHDSAGRFYSGDVAMLAAPVDHSSRRIKTIAKNGVIRLRIPPL